MRLQMMGVFVFIYNARWYLFLQYNNTSTTEMNMLTYKTLENKTNEVSHWPLQTLEQPNFEKNGGKDNKDSKQVNYNIL